MEMLMLSTWNEIPENEKWIVVHEDSDCREYFIFNGESFEQVDVELERAPRPRR